jgi:methylated-DNA-[protein]-cysteine S-methyltransferase
MIRSFALFNTPIGTCAIAWGEQGILGVSLPDSDPEATRHFISSRVAGAQERQPTPEVEAVMADIRRLFSGEPVDLLDARLDLTGVSEFHRRVYEEARRIPPGSTMTYGQIAQRLKAPGTARAIGQALGSNPYPIIVPCHRVLGANGAVGGFSAPGGVDTKLRILNIERRNAPVEASLFSDLPLAPPPRRMRQRRRMN